MTALNAALNYPAISYPDVALYLDMCVGEINTTLHTSLRTVGALIESDKARKIAEGSRVVLPAEPSGQSASIPCVDDWSEAPVGAWFMWASKQTRPELYRKFAYIASQGAEPQVRNALLAVYSEGGEIQLYEAHIYSDALCLWVSEQGEGDPDLTEILPEDWLTLFAIPYVCFKYTVRDGGTASTFAEEMEQGFQQLQETYDVPSEVPLRAVAGISAYAEDTRKAVESGVWGKCPTRAIDESMKHPRGVRAAYGSVYDAGGWGL